MTIKLGSLSRWKLVLANSTESVTLPGRGDVERRIRLHVNCAAATAFYRVIDGTDDEQLLASVPAGLHTLEFSASGDVEWFAATDSHNSQVWYQTADLEPTYSTVVDPVIFTKIANRRHRNPELEEVMYRMHLNVERRLAAQAEEFEAALERRRQEEDHGRPTETLVSDAPGAVAGTGGEEVRAPEPAASEPGETPGGSDGGGQSGS